MTPTARLLNAQIHRTGAGFHAEGWREPLALLDPFILVDQFRMSAPAFAPHPHAGFSAVTYLFDDSAGSLVSRDSLGGEHLIHPGDLHWTLAGLGVMHDDFPAQPGLAVHGLQMFVNLPAAQKLRAPEVMRRSASQMPRHAGPGWRAVQVFGGEVGLALPSPAALCIVDLAAGARFDWAVPDGEQGLAAVIHGSGQADSLPLAAGSALHAAGGTSHRLSADQPLRLACFSGQPLREPVVRHGPFVMSDEGQVVAALQRFQTGGMGRLCPRATPVPRPDFQEPRTHKKDPS